MWTELNRDESLDDVFEAIGESQGTARGPTAVGFWGAAPPPTAGERKERAFERGAAADAGVRHSSEPTERNGRRDKIVYAVVGFEPDRYGKREVLIIRERLNGFDVNEYRGYQRGGAALALWPKRKLCPSSLELRKFTISIYDTVREY